MKNQICQICRVVAAVAGVLLMASTAQANSVTFQNVTFTTTALDADSLRFDIDNATSANGEWLGATHLLGFSLKNFGTSVTSASIAPNQFNFSGNELNANGCLGGESGGACFDAISPILLTGHMSWTIDFVAPEVMNFDLPHLKIRFWDGVSTKTNNRTGVTSPVKLGTLYSDDIQIPPSTVPLPAAAWLFGSALFGFMMVSNRRKV